MKKLLLLVGALSLLALPAWGQTTILHDSTSLSESSLELIYAYVSVGPGTVIRKFPLKLAQNSSTGGADFICRVNVTERGGTGTLTLSLEDSFDTVMVSGVTTGVVDIYYWIYTNGIVTRDYTNLIESPVELNLGVIQRAITLRVALINATSLSATIYCGMLPQ